MGQLQRSTVATDNEEGPSAATGDAKTMSTAAGEKMTPKDGCTAAVKMAVDARVNDELDGCTEKPTNDAKSRAARYVATVRPAMAAQRYEWEGKQETKTDVPVTGEGDVYTDQGPKTGEGAESNQEKANQPTDGSTDTDGDHPDEVPTAMSAATIRRVRKQSRRIAKQRRVQKAVEKQTLKQADNEVERVVAELDAERQGRRKKQAVDVRRELVERWQRGDDRASSETVRVSLVREMKVLSATNGNTRVIEAAEASDGLPTATMTVEGQQRTIKIDSGARYSVAGTDWMMRGERVKKKAPVTHVEGIGGFLLDVLGVWRFEMTNVFGQPVTITACIIEGCTDEFLLGVDFLDGHRATMDFDGGEVRYDERGKEVVIPFRTSEEEGTTASVRLAGATNLVRRAVQPIEVAVAAPEGEEGVFVPTSDTGAVLMAAAVTKVRNGKALIPAINARGGRVKLPNKKELGVWIPLGTDMETLAMNNELKTDRLQKWLGKLGDTDTPLSNEEDIQVGVEDETTRDLVTRLLRSYRTLTEAPKDCPPATTLDVEHHIDTGDASPILLRRRRQAQTEDATIDENVDTMLKAGVIEESNGAWGFPVVLVKKKDGSVRFCVDYRALNGVTKRDVYPLPRIDETLEALGGARLFTTLDLQAGYWQITVARGDRDKTAFLTKRGLYRFRRMPFGLTNAPATFQRLMNGVLRGLTWTTCLVYLDDIVIFTKGDVNRHIVEVASVLERLANAGLSLKLKKCMFVAKSMEYLGHTLSARGVQPTERLVNAVREFPRPKDATEVKRFVHLAGYYRKFIAGFGSIAAPMTRLLKKDCTWQWTEEQEVAFERIKHLLTTRPVLRYPDFGRPFRLVTDASKVGLGAGLMQDFGHEWQPVAYASKVNSSAEANYSITELECLAVVWAVKLFRPYLYGRTFGIVTDHAALKWLMTRPNLAGRLHRWSLTLQEYDFGFEYRPGSTNVVADALSRAPVPNIELNAPAAVRAVVRPRHEQPALRRSTDNGEAVEAPAIRSAAAENTVRTSRLTEPATDSGSETTGTTTVVGENTSGRSATQTREITSRVADRAIPGNRAGGEKTTTTMRSPDITEVSEVNTATGDELTDNGSEDGTAAIGGTATEGGRTKLTTSTTTTNAVTAGEAITEAVVTTVTTVEPTTTETRAGVATNPPVVMEAEQRRRTRTAVPPVTRRSARIRERERRRVHFADERPPVRTTAMTTEHGGMMATGENGVTPTTRTNLTGNRQGTPSDNPTNGTAMAATTVTTAAVPTTTDRVTSTTGVTGSPLVTAITTTAETVGGTTELVDMEPAAEPQAKRRPVRRNDDKDQGNPGTTVVPSSTTIGGTRQENARPTATESRPSGSSATVIDTAELRATTQPTTARHTTTKTTVDPTRQASTAVRSKTTSLPTTVPLRTQTVEMSSRTPRTTTEAGEDKDMVTRSTRRTNTSGKRPRTDPNEEEGDDERERETPTLQLTDTEIIEAQKTSKFVKKTLTMGKHRGMKVDTRFGLAVIETNNGWRVLLPPTLWAVVFKEMHGSVWAGHLRGPHTYGRVAQLYWWPRLRRAVNQWIRGCPECGSRKARPREVIPPLRSISGGDVGDRWALDVAGPFPATDGGERFVVAAVEYVTRYAVARCVRHHKAEDIATFLMEEVVLKFGCFRELLTDGAPELTSSIIDVLVTMLQAHQTNAVAYRPQMIGLVERFHRTWKDCVAVFMQDEAQKDWNLWVRFAAYAYNSARHSTVLLTPNELMLGRRLRSPNELLRRTAVTEAGELTAYHEQLLAAMTRAQQCAEQARIREQERQARYYNRNVRQQREFKAGDRVWLYNPPRGPKATKFVHQWMGPMRIDEPVGYDNFRLTREDQTGKTEEMIAHVSFLVSYYEPESPLSQIAADIDEQLVDENTERYEEATAAPVRAASAGNGQPTTAGSGKRRRTATDNTTNQYHTSGQLVERRRRRRRNKAGHYVLEYQLFPIGDPRHWTTNDGEQWTTADGRPRGKWVSLAEYERYHEAERVVEDPWVGEDV